MEHLTEELKEQIKQFIKDNIKISIGRKENWNSPVIEVNLYFDNDQEPFTKDYYHL